MSEDQLAMSTVEGRTNMISVYRKILSSRKKPVQRIVGSFDYKRYYEAKS